jgi:hypothetical protein
MTTPATTLHRCFAYSDDRLTNPRESVLMPDGTLWSHAATLGTRTKGATFSVDRATIENFVRVFSVVPGARKLCVDYEHGTVNGATDRGEPVRKAGDILELKGVFAESDFTGELRTAAEKLTRAAGRPLSDPRNLGLWTRWRPTALALGYITAGEITEMSIAFTENIASNVDGSPQGPGLLSIALTNTPFLDDMVPVAASRDHELPATRGNTMTNPNPNSRVLSAVAALVGTTVGSDEEAITALTAHQPEVTRLRTFAREVGDAIGEPDTTKALAKIKATQAELTRLSAEAAAAKKAAIATQVEAFLVKHESKLTVPLKKMMANALSKEMEEGKPLAETETAATVESLPDTGITKQHSIGDKGEKATTDDQKIDAKAKELMESDAEVKNLTARDGFAAGFTLALRKVRAAQRAS